MIESPQSDIKLPPELQKAIEHSRNVVTINESEANRLGELIQSREYTIREQQKEMAELTGKIAKLQLDSANCENILNDLNKSILDKNTEKVKIDNELAVLRGSLSALKDFLYAN